MSPGTLPLRPLLEPTPAPRVCLRRVCLIPVPEPRAPGFFWPGLPALLGNSKPCREATRPPLGQDRRNVDPGSSGQAATVDMLDVLAGQDPDWRSPIETKPPCLQRAASKGGGVESGKRCASLFQSLIAGLPTGSGHPFMVQGPAVESQAACDQRSSCARKPQHHGLKGLRAKRQ